MVLIKEELQKYKDSAEENDQIALKFKKLKKMEIKHMEVQNIKLQELH